MAQELKRHLCTGFAPLRFPVKAHWKFIDLLSKLLVLLVVDFFCCGGGFLFVAFVCVCGVFCFIFCLFVCLFFIL